MAITEDRDKVRLLIGDTDENDPLLFDDEIAYFIQQRTQAYSSGTATFVNHNAAAADAAEAIAGKYARDFSFMEDGQSFSRAQRVNHYTDLARKLRGRAGGSAGIVPATGGTVSP
jgi:hypothetical protein